MLVKKLPIDIPPIYGYLQHAYHLSVAKRHPHFFEWFNCNYIQLKYYPTTGWLNFYSLDVQSKYYPLLNLEILSNTTIRNNKINIIEFVKNCIDDDDYVWIYIDEFYDPNRNAYHTFHQIHESLIYGYSLDECCLYTAGFNNEFSYTFSQIKFDDFLTAYHSAEGSFEIKILKPNVNSTYEFDIMNVKNIIEDYVNSEDTSLRNRMFGYTNNDNIIYGVDIYKYLKRSFENPIDERILKDIRPLHIMWEHKKNMVSRIQFLYEKKYIETLDPIYSTFIDIEEKVLYLRNLQIKYILADDHRFIEEIVNSIDEIYDQETEAFNKLLNCIK